MHYNIFKKKIISRPFINPKKEYKIIFEDVEPLEIKKHLINKKYYECQENDCQYCKKDRNPRHFYRLTVKDIENKITYHWDVSEINYSILCDLAENNKDGSNVFHLIHQHNGDYLTIEQSRFIKQHHEIEQIETIVDKEIEPSEPVETIEEEVVDHLINFDYDNESLMYITFKQSDQIDDIKKEVINKMKKYKLNKLPIQIPDKKSDYEVFINDAKYIVSYFVSFVTNFNNELQRDIFHLCKELCLESKTLDFIA